MLFEEYQIDGLRFDATRAIEGNNPPYGWRFLQELTYRIKERFPEKYLVAEHLEDHDTIIRDAGMHATWFAAAHHEFQRAARGEDAINKLKAFLGKDLGYGHNYPNQWNLVKYCLGSHDDCGDDKGGATLNKPGDWERHRYFVEFYGGRDNWYARAKARLGWALNVAAMGPECRGDGHAIDVHGSRMLSLGLLARHPRRKWRPPLQLGHRRRLAGDGDAPACRGSQLHPLDESMPTQ
jgi:1,4-alpha-glucan branching enzyme